MCKNETHTVPLQKNPEGRDSLSLISKIFYGALSKIIERPAASPHNFGRTNSLQSTANHLSLSEKDCYPSSELNTTIIDNACAPKTKSMSLLSDILPPPGYYISGAAAGVLSRTFTAPLDRIKVYLIADVSPSNEPRQSLKETLSLKSTRRIGQPLIDACKIIWRSGGLCSFFAGNGLNVVKVMPESGIKFGSFETAKRTFARFEGHGEPQKIKPLSNFICGGIAGGISQMQCETIQGGMHGNKLIMATAKKMYTQGAIQTAYRGLAMGLVGIFPYAAIDLGTFEYLKKEITQRNIRVRGCSEEEAVPSSLTLGFVGAVSGTFGASIVYPINVVRTRLQAQGTALHPPTYTGVWDVTRKTIESQGLKGLFKGITPNLLKVVPAVSITYMVYESSKKVLHLQ
ncbi:calcium-dependent mitochondrial carrier protein [Blumeria hordei DH14]|uniref:Mitochondrial thiamine pyrophosphate carrier 1 n=1 Tax=Blumeria graminis f. sp. hordei (strain DH14) TaxID=546991 RepID=N1JNN7_BLUG1|nr:calcium-dependent mitochondrial carrier protein [Blumeria hordei DH14]